MMSNLCFVGEKFILDEEVPHDQCNLCTTSKVLAEALVFAEIRAHSMVGAFWMSWLIT